MSAGTAQAGPAGVLAALALVLWPRRCAGCAEVLAAGEDPVGRAFCAPCAATLVTPEPGRSCPRCDGPWEGPAHAPAAPALEPAAGPCADCRRLQPCRFALLRAGYLYGGALVPALQRLKWQGRDDLAAPLGALLAPALRALAPRCDLLIPVPLHPRRLRQRGYNQSALLARAARRAARLPRGSLPLRLRALQRCRDDQPQRDADPRARALAAAGAFVVPAAEQAALRGRRVLLLDDVATTLATAQACAAALRDAGAAAVAVLTLARAAS